MKKKWSSPSMSVTPMNLEKLGDVKKLSDAQLKIRLEEEGYQFSKKYQASSDYIYRRVADSDVLISIGSNIADFNGYIQLNPSAVCLWKQLSEPKTLDQLEMALEETYQIPHEEAVEDVIDFLNELKEHDMITVQ